MKRLMPLALAVASVNAAAQALPVEHVLVSAPLQKQEAETALPVTILSGAELRRQAGATIGKTLGDTPGIANASFGPGVGQPVIRGQQGPRVTVLQNGLRSADAASVSADHAVSVEALRQYRGAARAGDIIVRRRCDWRCGQRDRQPHPPAAAGRCRRWRGISA